VKDVNDITAGILKMTDVHPKHNFMRCLPEP